MRRFRDLILPRNWDMLPVNSFADVRGDVGGASPGWYRPAHRQQNPAIDPSEPHSGESSDAGYDHGWSGCTMTSGAMVLDFHTLGEVQVWGGDLRHAPSQPDRDGGTDLWDVEKAWGDYEADLIIRTGAGWDGVRQDQDNGCALILTGSGNVPGAATFDGGHAICILPEVDSSGRWLQGDPLCSGWEWVSESALRTWAQHLEPSINYARSMPHPPSSSGDDFMFNVAPLTTHRDAIVREGAVLYSDSALSVRYSATSSEVALGFLGSTNEAHVVINGGFTNYVNRSDVLRIVGADRTFE